MPADFQLEMVQRMTRIETKLDALIGQPGRISSIEDRVEVLEAGRTDDKKTVDRQIASLQSDRTASGFKRAVKWAAYVGLAIGGYLARKP